MERMTKQRKLMLNELNRVNFHPTAEEFYEVIQPKCPGIGLATIYRNLDEFVNLDLINKIQGHPVRYEGNQEPHNHIKCIKCGKIEDANLVCSIDKKIIQKMGYQLANHVMEINGICQPCQTS